MSQAANLDVMDFYCNRFSEQLKKAECDKGMFVGSEKSEVCEKIAENFLGCITEWNTDK